MIKRLLNRFITASRVYTKEGKFLGTRWMIFNKDKYKKFDMARRQYNNGVNITYFFKANSSLDKGYDEIYSNTDEGLVDLKVDQFANGGDVYETLTWYNHPLTSITIGVLFMLAFFGIIGV